MDIENKWAFNETEDGLWSNEMFDTKEEAIEGAKDYLEDDASQEVMYIGQCVTISLPTYVDVDSIFDRLNENYAEECYEYDDYLFDDVTKKDSDWLEGKFADLVKEFYEKIGFKSTQYTIDNIEVVGREK